MGACDPHDVGEGEECGNPCRGAHGFSFAALECDGSEHDIDDQAQYFCGEPAMHERVLLNLPGISQGGNE